MSAELTTPIDGLEFLRSALWHCQQAGLTVKTGTHEGALVIKIVAPDGYVIERHSSGDGVTFHYSESSPETA